MQAWIEIIIASHKLKQKSSLRLLPSCIETSANSVIYVNVIYQTFGAHVLNFKKNFLFIFIYTIFQEGDIFNPTVSLPYGPLNI